MADYIRVVPINGVIVRHPDSFQDIPASGKRVRSAAYWIRMAEQGLVKIEDIQDEKSFGKKPKKKKPKAEPEIEVSEVQAEPSEVIANDQPVIQEEVAK